MSILKTYPRIKGYRTLPDWKKITKEEALEMGKELYALPVDQADLYLRIRSMEQYNHKPPHKRVSNCARCNGKGLIQDIRGYLCYCPACNQYGQVNGIPEEKQTIKKK